MNTASNQYESTEWRGFARTVTKCERSSVLCELDDERVARPTLDDKTKLSPLFFVNNLKQSYQLIV